MPSFKAPEPNWRGVQTFTITWRAKFLMITLGNMAAADWLPYGIEPEQPIPFKSWVRIEYRRPVLYAKEFGSRIGLLWPDGTVDFR